jgi:hypothetical protein
VSDAVNEQVSTNGRLILGGVGLLLEWISIRCIAMSALIYLESVHNGCQRSKNHAL